MCWHFEQARHQFVGRFRGGNAVQVSPNPQAKPDGSNDDPAGVTGGVPSAMST
jgi:hypothetical protein